MRSEEDIEERYDAEIREFPEMNVRFSGDPKKDTTALDAAATLTRISILGWCLGKDEHQIYEEVKEAQDAHLAAVVELRKGLAGL